jgi:hypothetical protein
VEFGVSLHILFLTDNFPPEVNAPASRTYEHAIRWVEMGCKVTVITGNPNFPEGKIYPGYKNSWLKFEIWVVFMLLGWRLILQLVRVFFVGFLVSFL